MYSVGERQAVSKLRKMVLVYEISFRSAIVLQMANRNSFAAQNMAKIFVDIQAMPRN